MVDVPAAGLGTWSVVSGSGVVAGGANGLVVRRRFDRVTRCPVWCKDYIIGP